MAIIQASQLSLLKKRSNPFHMKRVKHRAPENEDVTGTKESDPLVSDDAPGPGGLSVRPGLR